MIPDVWLIIRDLGVCNPFEASASEFAKGGGLSDYALYYAILSDFGCTLAEFDGNKA